MRGSVLCCSSNELFLIGSNSSVKSDEYLKKRYYVHDMVNCLSQDIALLSLLVVVVCYHFEKITSPYIHQNTRAACIVVSLVKSRRQRGQNLTDLRVRVAA